MNYHTEIAFALKVLQDAEGNDFDEDKMQAIVQQEADYMRVFLPQPYTLAHICHLAQNALYGLDRTIAIEKSIIAKEKRYEELNQQLEKLSAGKLWFFQKKKKQKTQDFQTLLADLQQEIYQCMEEVQSPSAAPWERDRIELCHIFGQLLCPPTLDNTEEFEQILCNEIHRFYGQKAKYFESLYN
ncbi:hypothetical protein [Microscilla marina]|uniref:Uncharacterized protein n=1 Tax=Microscilla marina ATCC 23134 TaxID=313606 RepID=A1ZLX4_MICM2|nr:hypothetical protein [Microscilla marina]EAY28506.1 hypothetical protein M23134_04353 [Microscilla marina ATCC 23134]